MPPPLIERLSDEMKRPGDTVAGAFVFAMPPHLLRLISRNQFLYPQGFAEDTRVFTVQFGAILGGNRSCAGKKAVKTRKPLKKHGLQCKKRHLLL
jgi:hypothetical protein